MVAPAPITELARAIALRIAEGRGVRLDDETSGVVVTHLPTGTRFAVDASGSYWSLAASDADAPPSPARFRRNTRPADEMPDGTEGRFAEVLEVPRHDFEDGLEAGARELGLPVTEALVAFPAVELIAAVLGMTSAYTARLALKWMLPSERAELAPVIARLAKNAYMTQDVRDLARHLGG